MEEGPLAGISFKVSEGTRTPDRLDHKTIGAANATQASSISTGGPVSLDALAHLSVEAANVTTGRRRKDDDPVVTQEYSWVVHLARL
jgi:hypothetical protein